MATRRVVINGIEQIDPRSTRAWRKLRDRVVREEPTCQLRLPGVCIGASTTADHIETVERRPDLALVRTNVRGSCVPCNEARHTTPDEALRLDPPTEPPALGVFR